MLVAVFAANDGYRRVMVGRGSRLSPNPAVCIGEVGDGLEYRPPVGID